MLSWRLSPCRINDRGNAASSDVPPIPVVTGSGSEDRVSTPAVHPGRGPSRQKFEASSSGRIHEQQETAETERNETDVVDQRQHGQILWECQSSKSTVLLSFWFLLMIPRTTRYSPYVMGHEQPDACPLSTTEFLLRKATRKKLHGGSIIEAQARPAQIMCEILAGLWLQTKTSEILRPVP